MIAVLLICGLTIAFCLAQILGGRRHRPLPPLLLPALLLSCGCLRIGGGLLLPCAGHDPAAEPPVEQWAAEMEEQ